jgi:hypothetical protein
MNPTIVINILVAIATYYTLTRNRIQSLCLPGYDERSVRRILLQLVQQGLLNKMTMEVVDPSQGAPAPIYYPSRRGIDHLVADTKCDGWYQACSLRPNWQHAYHWLKVADTHIAFDKAVALQQDVQIPTWLHEWDICNPDEREPHKRFKLFLQIRESPRLVAAPDSGFVLSYRGYQRAYYLELDRHTSGIQQIAASKTPGYAAMAEKKLHDKHFPGTGSVPFRVVCVALTPGRRDALRRAIATKQGAALWRFTDWQSLKPETLLHDPIFYRCPNKEEKDSADEPVALIKRLGN